MNVRKKKSLSVNSHLVIRAFAGLMLILPCSLLADEWFVDPDNGNDETGTGLAEAPFLSIQKAVDSASVDDTIVLLPGEHKTGESVVSYNNETSKTRVSVSKRLTFRSLSGRSSRDATIIKGAWDTTPGDYPYGMGDNAVRCVDVLSDAAGTRFEGITFSDGSSPYLDGEDGVCTRGGGVNVWGQSGGFAYFFDCAFKRCQAIRGGAVYVGNDSLSFATRCLFKDNRASKYGAATRGVNCFACVFDGNDATRNEDSTVNAQSDSGTIGSMSYCQKAVNCTCVNNYTRVGYEIDYLDNCTFIHAFHSNWASTVTKVRNLVSDVDANNIVGDGELEEGSNIHKVTVRENPEVYSPHDEDYRLVKNAVSIGTGLQEYIAAFSEMFSGVDGVADKDYYGNAYPLSGAVNCGATQDSLEFESSALVLKPESGNGSAATYTVNGKEVFQSGFVFVGVPGWPMAFNVKFTPKSGEALVRYSVNGNISWAKMDGSIWVAPPASTQAVEVKPVVTSNITYVDPKDGYGDDTTGDGSSAKPYETIQKAINMADKSMDHVIYALSGSFDSGSTKAKELNTRVLLPSNYEYSMLIKAVDGPSETFIIGERDDDTGNGLGVNACRCVALADTTSAVCMQGFTLKNGFTATSGTASDTYGAALYGSRGAYLVDCVISNCFGQRSVVNGAAVVERCLFADCTNATFGVVRGADVYSSLFNKCKLTSSNGIISNGAQIYNSTFIECSSVVRYSNSSDKGYLYNCVVNGSLSSVTLEADQAYCTLYKTSTKGQDNLTTVVKDDSFEFSSSEDYSLPRSSAGYRLGSIEYMKSLMDFYGNPFTFLSSGNLTAGAVERDWKADVVSASGEDDIEIMSAYAAAFPNDDGIFLPYGNLSFAWDMVVGGYYDFKVNVTGNGTLYVYLNGELLRTCDSGFDGRVLFAAKKPENSFMLSYEPLAGDTGGVALSCFGRYVGLQFIIR